jgi:tRNA A37 threonylcarbamoyltransferase TsaD
MEGEVVTHTYARAGTYQVKVVALSGGVATSQKLRQ